MGKADSVVSHIDFAARAPGSGDRGSLRELVDGPVMFSGYQFFADAWCYTASSRWWYLLKGTGTGRYAIVQVLKTENSHL